MNGLRDYWDGVIKLEQAFNIQIDSGIFVDIIDQTMDALDEDIEYPYVKGEESWVYYFAFELDWGRSERAKTAVEIHGVKCELTSAEKLYDLILKLKRNEDNDE